MHVDISGEFEAAQCALVRWAVGGQTCDVVQHRELAGECQASWRNYVARGSEGEAPASSSGAG